MNWRVGEHKAGNFLSILDAKTNVEFTYLKSVSFSIQKS